MATNPKFFSWKIRNFFSFFSLDTRNFLFTFFGLAKEADQHLKKKMRRQEKKRTYREREKIKDEED